MRYCPSTPVCHHVAIRTGTAFRNVCTTITYKTDVCSHQRFPSTALTSRFVITQHPLNGSLKEAVDVERILCFACPRWISSTIPTRTAQRETKIRSKYPVRQHLTFSSPHTITERALVASAAPRRRIRGRRRDGDSGIIPGRG